MLKPYGAKFITFDDNVTVLEGEREAGRTVIIQFPSEKVLMEWWNSPEYRELAAIRHQATTTFSVSVIHAIPQR